MGEQPCFNPRPSSLTGEPPARHAPAAQHRRFNPRPSSLTGEPYAFAGTTQDEMFQSTPVITDGRTGITPEMTRADERFNPRPSSLTGEPG